MRKKSGSVWLSSSSHRSDWNHSNALDSRLIQMNSTRRRAPSLFFCWQCQMFLRIDANGVTPMPVWLLLAR